MAISDRAHELAKLAKNIPTDRMGFILTGISNLGQFYKFSFPEPDPKLIDRLRNSWLQLTDIGTALEGLKRSIEAQSAYHLGLQERKTTSINPTRKSETSFVTAKDGARYPVRAGWCIDSLPPRVIARQGHRTVGYMKHLAKPLVSGQDSSSGPVRERLLAKGYSQSAAEFLSSHVELKAAIGMLQRGQSYGELVINNFPCEGRGYYRPGCADVLQKFLPEGYTLVVHGTTNKGEPFSQSYIGKSES